MNSDQQLPLAKRITQGELYLWQGTRGSPRKLKYFGVELGPNILYMGDSSPNAADAELIAEAFNVTHKTGKTPRELVEAIKEINDIIFGPAGAPCGSPAYFKIREICCSILHPKNQP